MKSNNGNITDFPVCYIFDTQETFPICNLTFCIHCLYLYSNLWNSFSFSFYDLKDLFDVDHFDSKKHANDRLKGRTESYLL